MNCQSVNRLQSAALPLRQVLSLGLALVLTLAAGLFYLQLADRAPGRASGGADRPVDAHSGNPCQHPGQGRRPAANRPGQCVTGHLGKCRTPGPLGVLTAG